MPKLQETVDLSPLEVEYIAASHACKEAIWLRGLLREIERLQNSVPLFCDSQSAIHLATNPVYHIKTKHIDVKYHFARQAISEGGVDLKKVYTKQNCADMFTKLVLLENLRCCVASLVLKKR